MQMPREFYLPKDAQQVPVDVNAAIYCYTSSNGKPAACAFIGKASKPSWRYYFSTEEQRQKHITEQVEACKAREKMKAEWKAERSRPHTLKVGDILVSSGGYDQTNVWACQVVGVTASSVDVREIAIEQVRQGADGLTGQYASQSMADHVKPVRDAFVGEIERKRSNSTNCIKAIWGSASPWDGERSYYRSWYG